MSSEEGSDYHVDVAATKPEDKVEVSNDENEAEAVEDNQDQNQDPFPVRLPREIIDIIFSYLDPASIKRVRLVSRLL